MARSPRLVALGAALCLLLLCVAAADNSTTSGACVMRVWD